MYITENAKLALVILTEAHRMSFIQHRIARQSQDAVVACDSTTRSAWGRHIADIRHGINKDNPNLFNTSEVVVYAVTDHQQKLRENIK